MKVIHYSGDSIGGAGRASVRIHNALKSNPEVDSTMIVRQKMNDDWRIAQPNEGIITKVCTQIRPYIDFLPARLHHSENNIPRSPAWVSAITAKQINQSDADVINLHWICSGFLSIEEIGKIRKPVVWTLHDMWAFCGAEHLAEDANTARWRVGYAKSSRNSQDWGFDIDRWVWRRKKKSWLKPMHIVTPSRWLADCVQSSELMMNWNVTVIPNPLDTLKYKPSNKQFSRETLGLPLNSKLIAFGAILGTKLNYKGWDLLQPALIEIAKTIPDAQVVIFGQSEPKDPPLIGMPIHWMGHLYDDYTLSLIYSAADLLVVPSRQESFCQTASEAQACGCPVVAFKTTGLLDVVEHQVTGYLVNPFSVDDLKKGIEWVLDNTESLRLSGNARQRAESLWGYQQVLEKYLDLYKRVVS
jgi:glycosyltransferase involved in cell wall biosynthesis